MRLIFLALIVLVFFPIVMAAPPVTQTQQFTEGFNLKFPEDEYLKQNQDYEFEVHVYNISNGLPMTNNISCYFYLYNSSGKHHLELANVTPSHNFDYSFYVAGGNFSEVGHYYYLVQCNNSVLGGFIESSFEVNPAGIENNTSQSMTYIIILSMFILILFVCLFGFITIPTNNGRGEDGYIESINWLKYLKYTLLVPGYLSLIGILFLTSNVAYAFTTLVPIANLVFYLYKISLAMLLPIMIGIVLFGIIKFARDFRDLKYIDRGLHIK
jgi:hypothetical protein